MYLKSCCALLLLALVACQAAPSTSKNIEKKSINEKTSKIEKDDMQMEDPGMDKDRAKKSTTFCVEVHDGVQQQVPCKEAQPNLVLIQPEPRKQTLLQHHQPTLVNVPLKYAEAQILPQQSLHVIQAQQPQTLHIQQPYPQPSAQPVIVMPPPQLPAAQPAPAPQAPIVNILTPPAAPCNVMPSPTVIHEKYETFKPLPKPELVKPELPKPKPLPQPLPHPLPLPVEFIPAEPAPCKQELLVLPSKPLPVYPEYTMQLTEVERRPQPVEAECTCTQKGHQYATWPRHHHKVHEHHVMVHPTANVMPTAPLVVQPPCPVAYLNSQPTVLGGYPGKAYGPMNTVNAYGDTVIAVRETQPYDSNSPSEYSSYPVESYNSRPYTSPNGPVVNVLTEATGIFRQAQLSPESQKQWRTNVDNKLELQHRVGSTTIPMGTSKREAESVQLKQQQQTNIVQEQMIGSDKLPAEMQFGEQGRTK